MCDAFLTPQTTAVPPTATIPVAMAKACTSHVADEAEIWDEADIICDLSGSAEKRLSTEGEVLDEVGRGAGRWRLLEVFGITCLGGGALASLRATVRRRRSCTRGMSTKLVPKNCWWAHFEIVFYGQNNTTLQQISESIQVRESMLDWRMMPSIIGPVLAGYPYHVW